MEQTRHFEGGSSVGKTKKLVGIAILAAIIVVLQLVAYLFPVGQVSITLVLIPVVVGAAIYGVEAGAILGAAFGIIVTIGCITGIDKGGAILLATKPITTVLLCLVKGTAAGFLAGVVYRAIARNKKRTYLGVITAAIVSPVVNTGIFLAAMVLFYHDTLLSWAGGTEITYFVLIGLTGINFLIELVLNMVLSPVAVRIIKIGKAM